MDFVWDSLGCDNRRPDPSQLSQFYRHPIWLLNGLFIEKHDQSLRHRIQFRDWTTMQKPKKVADYGGGFGTLGRMIAAECPDSEVHIIDPYPTELAKRRLQEFRNATFVSEPQGPYDVILATDVFEHVMDPLSSLFDVAEHVRVGGKFLVANHFAPSIKCHLPATFHFRHTWHTFMKLAGFCVEGPISYGWAYEKVGARKLTSYVRICEKGSRRIYEVTQRWPRLGRLVERACLNWAS